MTSPATTTWDLEKSGIVIVTGAIYHDAAPGAAVSRRESWAMRKRVTLYQKALS